MVQIYIDGQAYQVKAGDNLLQACLSLGLDLPYFCWHPALGSVGACRQCALVQYQQSEDQQGRIVMGCMTPVTEGARFSLNGDKAKGFRQTVVEALMLNHPHDCPVCAEGGECHLQDVTVMTGHRDRHYRGLKNTHRNQYLGPLIHHQMNRCITCYRCTRYYRDYAGGTDLAAMAAHDHIYFGRHQEGVLESEFAGNLIEVCPTGVFTDQTLVNEYTRKWDLQSAPSLCIGCAVGCNTLPGERYGKLKRIHNRFNAEVNGYFLCDRGRFGAAFVNSAKRLDQAGLQTASGRYDAISQQQALQAMVDACQEGKLAGIGSPRSSVEANFLLRTLVGKDNFCPGFSDQEQPLVQLTLQLQQQSSALIADIRSIETADAVLILGEDLSNSAPRIALALRQSVRNKAYAMSEQLGLQSWQDAAIRNLAQDQRSPLFIVATGDTRLDDIAEQTLHLAPDDIARLTVMITAKLAGLSNTSEPTSSQANISETNHHSASSEVVIEAEQEATLAHAATTIARALQAAKRPLIITGTSCAHAGLLTAAAELAETLCNEPQQAMLCLTVAEANSLGQALLVGGSAASLKTLTAAAIAGDIQTLVVMENDLYRRGRQQDIDKLLQQVPTVIAMDCLDNRSLSASSLALPTASFLETEGTIISLEGRAQRHFPVWKAKADRPASWQWLLSAMQAMNLAEVSELVCFDDVSQACAQTVPALADIVAAAPDHHYRNRGVKIPRQPPRYSGRTAMLADRSVHEPKQAVDEDSALAYSMEGLNQDQPGALLPYVWSPGWNSNQALHKFQAEVGGPLIGGTAGHRLLQGAKENNRQRAAASATALAPKFQARREQWLLVARYKIFGSDELSAESHAIGQLIQPACIEISPADAKRLQISEGDSVTVGDAALNTVLPLRINAAIAKGCAGFSAGFSGTENLVPGEWVRLSLAVTGKKTPQLIASDGGELE